MHGRVGSLLEVGTGFHPELTGRENIYLNGAILGMTKAEIASKFDEIVAFAEIEQFLDTPVKHYSSGMYMRLAFAVAAHLEPEILVVDEVLAVGDASFQKKCIGKMENVAKGGRTVLFVSHNVAALEALCQRCVLLTNGKLDSVGPTAEITTKYLQKSLTTQASTVDLSRASGRRGGATPVMKSVTLFSESESPVMSVRMGAPLSVRVTFRSEEPVQPICGVTVKTSLSMPVFGTNNLITKDGNPNDLLREGVIFCRFDALPLMPGTYSLDLWCAGVDMIRDAISFEVLPADILGTGKLPPANTGPVFCMATWTYQSEAVPR